MRVARQHNTSVSLGPRDLCTYYSYRISSLHVVSPRPQGAFSMPRATDPGRISERGGAYAPVRHSIPHPSGKSGPAAAESGPGKHYMPGTAWHDAVDSGQRLARAALSRGYRDYYNSQSGGGAQKKTRRYTSGLLAGGTSGQAAADGIAVPNGPSCDGLRMMKGPIR